MPRRTGPVAIIAACSHLAVWAGLYVTAALICFAQIAAAWPAQHGPASFRIGLYAFCTAAGIYLLDRVKLTDALLDPADRAAHPDRFEFLTRRATLIRALAASLLIAGLAVGMTVSAFTALLSLAACIGIIAYAGRPRRRRPRIKDYVILKNAFVAAGITGFAAVLTAIVHDPRSLTRHDAGLWSFSAIHLFIRVWADAALCDLDDEHADRAFGTSTLATRLGRSRARDIALTLRLALAAALLLIPAGPFAIRASWAAVTAVSSIVLRLARPRRIRDWVDARFPIEVALAWSLARFLG